MSELIRDLTEFLDKAHSPYHAAALLAELLEQAGFHGLQEKDAWALLPGEGYYLVRGGSAVIAFRIPQTAPTGFMLAASHDDCPGFVLKDSLERTGRYTRLETERYGGGLLFTWPDRPLSLAGRVMVETDGGVEARLIDIDRDLTMIPNVAIHLNREVNNGYKWNPAVDMIPLLGGEQAAGKLRALLEHEAGGKILGMDLRLYVRQKASRWGMEEEYLSAMGLDDLTCAYASVRGFLEADDSGAIPMLCVFDNEEVGSATCQGADSALLESVLERICRVRGLDLRRMLSQSFAVSADNGHALHPNHPELSDPENAPLVNGGIALKFNANRRYTTDGFSTAVFRGVCKLAGIGSQDYCNRGDLPGGSTLGNISISHVSVPTVDIGLPQLAMHSCYETVGVKDVEELYAFFKTYFGKAIVMPREGVFQLK